MRIPAIAVLLALSAIGAMAQQPRPREINIGDLIQGNVSAGTIVIARGHLAYVGGQALLNPDMPSAMVPASVDIARLPSAETERLQAQCVSDRITSGGCSVQVQGEVQQINNRPGLIASDIEFLSPAR